MTASSLDNYGGTVRGEDVILPDVLNHAQSWAKTPHCRALFHLLHEEL
jgi:hypothetical protein